MTQIVIGGRAISNVRARFPVPIVARRITAIPCHVSMRRERRERRRALEGQYWRYNLRMEQCVHNNEVYESDEQIKNRQHETRLLGETVKALSGKLEAFIHWHRTWQFEWGQVVGIVESYMLLALHPDEKMSVQILA